jgi:hypothetical protein
MIEKKNGSITQVAMMIIASTRTLTVISIASYKSSSSILTIISFSLKIDSREQ